MDLLLTGGTVVTMNREREVLAGADVLVQDGRVAKVGRGLKPRGTRRVVDVAGKVVLPGLIHGHLHACQTLFRGRADGLELLDWLRERIWPFEAAHDAASMRASADLTFAELIRSVGARGYTSVSGVSGFGHHGIRGGRMLFNDHDALTLLITVVPDHRADAIVAGIRPILDRTSGVMFVSPTAVSRPDYFA